MAQVTQEKLDKIKDQLRDEYGYDKMSDEDKAKFDGYLDAAIEKRKEDGRIEVTDGDEDNGDNTNQDGDGTNQDGENTGDGTDDGNNEDGENGNMENGMERERGRDGGGGESEEKKKEEEAETKESAEYAQLNNDISDNQKDLDAERQKEAEEAEKKERDRGDRSR